MYWNNSGLYLRILKIFFFFFAVWVPTERFKEKQNMECVTTAKERQRYKHLTSEFVPKFRHSYEIFTHSVGEAILQ